MTDTIIDNQQNLETRKFDTEVGKILNLMINSLYTNKEIFLRELISNASDACDKLRYLAQSDDTLIKEDADLKIKISCNKEQRTITIKDNGIGMNHEDLVQNLGTIASSGTQRFMDQLTGDSKKDSLLIGQFGVGFYSAFMIAEQVKVLTRKAGEQEAWMWQSEGQGEYSIAKLEGQRERGTEIILTIKEEELDFIDHFRLKHITKTYSDHISIPILFIDESNNETQLNSASAIWTKNKSDITEDDYQEFYKNVSFAADKPWLTLHNKNEGLVEFTNLLFIPTNKTFDLFHPDRRKRVKLYIKRVFITDENVDLVPGYMRFLRGVVDSEDLPLNISRENLQHNATIEKIKQTIVKRVLSELKQQKNSNLEQYTHFWNNFGAALKEGLCEPIQERDKLMEVCLFRSAISDKLISLDEYIENMPKEQKYIYYLSGEDAEKLKNSPQIEGFLSKNIDVLLFTDSVDDFWVNVSYEYKDKELKSVTKYDASLEQDSTEKTESDSKQDEAKEQSDTPEAKVINFMKEILGDKVKDVKISKKLTNSPVCLSVAEGGMDIRMERFLIEQKQLLTGSSKILEINPKHPIIAKISQDLSNDATDQDNKDLVQTLFDQACLIEGEPIGDVNSFTKRLNKFIEKTF